MKIYLKYLAIFAFCLVFFSYRLVEVPEGLTIDEGAFGYNAVLLSETLQDENGRFLPIFVLSIDGKDWRQPVTQYSQAVFFKIFGPSIFNLRFVSVVFATISALLIYFFGRRLMGEAGGIFSLLFFLTTPVVMMHSHLGLDNLAPLLFVLLWLIFLYLFERKGKLPYLVISGFALGAGFYSYKGMRSFAPVWSVLTVFYLTLPYFKKRSKVVLKKIAKPAFTFSLAVLPFYAAIPFLEKKYAGAVLGNTGLAVDSIYKFLLSFLSSFDPSFLFITGDSLLHHSTGKHGMLLLVSLPFFILGLTRAFKKDKFFIFLVVSFFAGPLLFGFPGSIHRASRLIAFVPLYALICSVGAYYLHKGKAVLKTVLIVFLILVALNYYDFVNYYWYQYPKDTYHIFYSARLEEAYGTLKNESESRGLTPYVSPDLLREEGTVDEFLRAIHFTFPPAVWEGEVEKFPEDAILMTRKSEIEGLNRLEVSPDGIYFYTK